MKLAVNGRFLLQDVTGVQRVAIEFLHALDRLLVAGTFPGLEVTVWIPRKGQLVSKPQLNAISVRRGGALTGHLWEQTALPILTRRAPLLCLGNLAPVARLMFRNQPTYTMVHDLSYKYFPGAYSRTFRLLYGVVVPMVLLRSAHIFTVSASEKAAILRHYPRIVKTNRLTAVQNGGGEGIFGTRRTTTDQFSPAPDHPGAAPSRKHMVLYVGSLTKRKNGAGLLQAAMSLAETEEVEFVIVGATGASFDDTGIDMTHRPNDKIAFLGQINDPKRVAELYRQAMAFVFPSFYEASPLPPIEAMSFGTPVVCSDIPSLRERCGDAALYCDPANYTSIVGQVERLLADGDLWREMQHRGFVQAAKYSWEAQAARILRVILDS